MNKKSIQPLGLSTEKFIKLTDLKQQVVNEELRLYYDLKTSQLKQLNDLPIVQDFTLLQKYNQKLDDFVETEIDDPLISLTIKVSPIEYREIQQLTNEESCLLQWYVTDERIIAFIVSANNNIRIWQSPEKATKQLFDTYINYMKLYNRQETDIDNSWKDQLPTLLQNFSDLLHLDEVCALVPHACQHLIVIPHSVLHNLPLHALPISRTPQASISGLNSSQVNGFSEKSTLQDLFPLGVQYAPSCQILARVKHLYHHVNFSKLLAIQNPINDLCFSDLECTILSTFFSSSEILVKDNANRTNVLNQLKSLDNHCYHFSCHGTFTSTNLLESTLYLANNETLTLSDIFELRFSDCRLVTLSACETGLTDITLSDEYFGLSGAFMCAGCPSIVSSLWSVNDLSTAFLMIKFYRILSDDQQYTSVSVAMQQAQQWLCNLTVQGYMKYLTSIKLDIQTIQTRMSSKDFKRLMHIFDDEEARIRASAMELNHKLFSNPFYWAAFSVTGV